MTWNDAYGREPVAIGDEARNITFGEGGYDASQVDDLLARIAAELDAGRPAGPLIANATFQKVSRRGYDIRTVDWFLDQLRRREDLTNDDPWFDLAADPYCIRHEPGDPARHIAAPWPPAYADAWDDFARQPGTRLSWVTTGALRHELRTTKQQTVASSRGGFWTGAATLTAGGRTFTWKRVTRSSWPGIADTISHDWPLMPAHLAAHTLDPEAGKQDPLLRQLRDETGRPVLYSAGRHFYIKFPGQRWLRFPVRGTTRANAIMTAVDQAGNKVARYRLIRHGSSFRRTTEITVHPDQLLTDELALAIAASAPWLSGCFGSLPEVG